jgi:hypothetical protein
MTLREWLEWAIEKAADWQRWNAELYEEEQPDTKSNAAGSAGA